MEPNKLENQIQEKLNSREIQPSAQSWDRLDAMLSVTETKKQKRSFGWLYIAASVVGFVFMGLYFFNQNETIPEINNNPTVVESNIENTNSTVEEPTAKTQSIVNDSKQVKQIINIENKALAVSEKNASKKTHQNHLQKTNKIETIESNKLEEQIVTNVSKTEEKEIIKSTALLAEANIDTSEKAIQNKPKLKINANALLSEVDGEIELTFRQKAIKTITKQYENTRGALATRNIE